MWGEEEGGVGMRSEKRRGGVWGGGGVWRGGKRSVSVGRGCGGGVWRRGEECECGERRREEECGEEGRSVSVGRGGVWRRGEECECEEGRSGRSAEKRGGV